MDRPINIFSQDPNAADDNFVRRRIEEKLAREDAAFRAATEVNKSIPAAEQAKALPLAKENNIPSEVARRNLRELEEQKKRDNFYSILDRRGSTGRLAADPDHGPIATEYVSELDEFERRLNAYKGDGVLKSLGKGIAQSTADIGLGTAQYGASTDAMANPFGSPGQTITGMLNPAGTAASMAWSALSPLWGGEPTGNKEASQAVAKLSKEVEEAIAYQPMTDLQRDIIDTFSKGEIGRSLANIPGFAAEQFIVGLPYMLTAVVAPALSQAANTGRIAQDRAGNDGRDYVTNEDLAAAAPAAALMTFGERFGFGRMMRPGTGLMAPVRGAAAEGGTEFLEETAEYTASTLGTEKGFDLSDAGVAGLGGFLGGAPAGAVVAAGKATLDAYILRAEKRRDDLIDLGDKIRNSKVNSLSPDTLTALADQIEKDGGPAMSAPAEKLVELFQAEGLTPEQVQEQFPEIAAAVTDAVEGGAEVPLNARTIAKLVTLEGFKNIADDVRTGPGERTPNELKQDSKDFEAFVATVSEEDKRMAVRASIENEVTKQLVASGQEPRAAATMAKVHASFYIETAARTKGLTPDDIMRRYNLTITGDQQTDMTAVDPNTTMLQGNPQIDTPEFKNWFGESKVVDEAGAPLVVYHGTDAVFTEFKETGKRDAGWHGPGFYFYPKEQWAKGYGKNVMPVYLNLKNPAIRKTSEAARTPEEADALRRELEAAGHDGVMAYDADGTLADIVVFSPTQIKSVENRGTFAPDDPNILYQSGVPLLDNPLKIDGKVTVKAIGQAMTDDHMAKHGRQFFPEDSEADYQIVLGDIAGELGVQLRQPNSGVGWYSKDVQLSIELAARVYPTLLTNPAHRKFYLTLAGLFSNGMEPEQAFMISAEAFETFLATGQIPVSRAEAATMRGAPVQTTTFKDRKTGKDVTKPAGWGIRNSANEQQLALVKYIVEREGSLEAGLNWLMTPQPRTAINEAMTANGLYKAGRYTTKAEIAGPPAQGLMAFGEKLGRYTMGLHGVEIDAGDTTVDLWYTRTYRRLVGRLMEGPIGNEGIVGGPTDKDRQVIFKLTGDLAKEYDLPPGDVQAVLWFFEKRLWGAQGLRTNEGINSSGARKLLRSKGLDDGSAAPNDGEGSDGAGVGAGGETAGTTLAAQDQVGDTTLNQRAQTTQSFARGSIAISPGKDKFTITLTGKADLSTFMHEAGHYYLEVLQALVASGDASPEMVADLEKIRGWMGLDPTQQIDRKQHEQWARGWEAYLMEGRAPSADLQGAFNRFRAWLVFIYKRLSNLNVELNDDIRGVMDRLIASDAEIAEARTNIGWAKPLPKEALYLNDDEYDRYVEAWNKASEAQQREVDARLMLEAARETQQAWKDERRQVFEEEKAKLAQTRGYRAWKLLTTGEGLEEALPGRTTLKIDPATVPAEWSRDAAGMTEEGGLPLDFVAEALGFRSGEEMLSLTAGAKFAERELPRRVKQIMAERHGDLDMTALADIANDAVHSDKTQEVLLTEFRAMSAAAGIPPAPKGMTKWMAAQAQQKVLGLTRRQLDPMRWRRAELKAAQQAAKAKDPAQAAIFKRQQMMAAAMYKATVDADKRVDVIRKKLMPFTKNDRRAKLGKAGDLYLDGIDQILEDIQLKPMSAASVQKLDRLQKLVEEADKNGEPLVLPDKLRAMLGKKNFADMTLEELEGVHDAVMNIWHLAKLKNELKARNEKRQLEEALTEMEENARRALGDPNVTVLFTKGWKDRAAARMRAFRAALTKMEFLFGWLDGKPDGGLMHRLIYQPIADANKAKYDILKRFQETIIERMRDMPKEQKARWGAKRTFMGNPTANGATIIAAAMNLGNAGNKQKLIEGYKWNEQQLTAEINAFMTKADWDFVQHVWDEIDTLWPKIEATTKAATGLAPEKVVPTPVVTPFGTYAGGYYPVVYDPEQTEEQFRNQQKENDLFTNNYARPTLGNGFTKARVDYSAPMLLDLSVISQHLAEVVHYVTHYEAVTQANKIVMHPRFKALVRGHMGNEFYRTLPEWLQHVARDQDQPEITSREPFAKAMRHLRGGVSIAAMGFNIFTGVKQLIGVVQSLDAIGPKYWFRGLAEAWASPNAIENWKFAFKHSQELEPLVTQLDRDIKMVNDAYAMQTTMSIPAKVASWAFKHIGWLQAAVNVATWRGAYHQEMDRTDDHEKAVMHADAVVRQTQSAGAVKDLSPIQRGSEINRAVSMFYSWFNVLYNRLEDINRQTRGIRDVPKAAARVAILVMMSSAIEEAGRRAWEGIVDNYDEDEDERGYILSVLLKSVDTALGAIPLARVFVSADAATGGFTPDLVPVAGVVDDYWRTLSAGYDWVVEGETPTRAEVKRAIRTVSILGAVPLSGPYNLLDELFGEAVFDERKQK